MVAFGNGMAPELPKFGKLSVFDAKILNYLIECAGSMLTREWRGLRYLPANYLC